MLPSHSGSIPLFRFAGIQVYLHWWWFVFAVLEITMRSRAYSSYAWNITEYLALFGIVLLHEFGHAFACRQTGGKAEEIVLWPLGGIAFVRPPPRPGAELWSIAAGPLVNVVLVPVIYGAAWITAQMNWGERVPDLPLLLAALWVINIGLLAFNLLPIYPLDGGQIFRSLLWFMIGRARSLFVASALGLVGIAVLAAYFLWQNPDRWLLILLLGGFLAQQCLMGFREAKRMQVLSRQPRHVGLACPMCGAAPPGGPLWLCSQCGQRYDPFATRGVCPHCATVQSGIPCPQCGNASSLAAWEAAGGSRSG